mmetsp:Transcript_1963/g.5216  ORF Transcript_1963/g.5216 Transcript_1963/m.5216 type:complete len:270 (-) Transcript_1963:797-1606(-)
MVFVLRRSVVEGGLVYAVVVVVVVVVCIWFVFFFVRLRNPGNQGGIVKDGLAATILPCPGLKLGAHIAAEKSGHGTQFQSGALVVANHGKVSHGASFRHFVSHPTGGTPRADVSKDNIVAQCCELIVTGVDHVVSPNNIAAIDLEATGLIGREGIALAGFRIQKASFVGTNFCRTRIALLVVEEYSAWGRGLGFLDNIRHAALAEDDFRSRVDVVVVPGRGLKGGANVLLVGICVRRASCVGVVLGTKGFHRQGFAVADLYLFSTVVYG